MVETSQDLLFVLGHVLKSLPIQSVTVGLDTGKTFFSHCQ